MYTHSYYFNSASFSLLQVQSEKAESDSCMASLPDISLFERHNVHHQFVQNTSLLALDGSTISTVASEQECPGFNSREGTCVEFACSPCAGVSFLLMLSSWRAPGASGVAPRAVNSAAQGRREQVSYCVGQAQRHLKCVIISMFFFFLFFCFHLHA